MADAQTPVLADEQILAIGIKWAKEEGWFDFERNDFISAARELLAAQAPSQPAPTMADALAAGDGTLHGAVDHWQEQALADRAVMQQALDALLGVRSNMQQNAPHLSGKVWGDADAAIAALSTIVDQK